MASKRRNVFDKNTKQETTETAICPPQPEEEEISVERIDMDYRELANEVGDHKQTLRNIELYKHLQKVGREFDDRLGMDAAKNSKVTQSSGVDRAAKVKVRNHLEDATKLGSETSSFTRRSTPT
ncbi:hypothetical protein AAG570_002190 [Ranatra chinensis]|uniref:Uncharacterized protein n=1 Tax=Ranatra chinensis TaxID=642074 RepID=A0ABD0YJ43_9HEMI